MGLGQHTNLPFFYDFGDLFEHRLVFEIELFLNA